MQIFNYFLNKIHPVLHNSSKSICFPHNSTALWVNMTRSCNNWKWWKCWRKNKKNKKTRTWTQLSTEININWLVWCDVKKKNEKKIWNCQTKTTWHWIWGWAEKHQLTENAKKKKSENPLTSHIAYM